VTLTLSLGDDTASTNVRARIVRVVKWRGDRDDDDDDRDDDRDDDDDDDRDDDDDDD
jgi:hypothetical protein